MRYSKNEITRAGNVLLSSKIEDERDLAYLKINDWRTNHLQPLRVLKKKIIDILNEHKITPLLVSQRLKRLTSIIYKLDLNPSMGLGGMQDIGGCRVVLKDVKDLDKLKKILDNNSPYKIIKFNDYVENPKDSGYRSIHYVYKYSSKADKYNGLKIELQIRTKLQHNWATAVETAGAMTRTSLKSSQGDDKWLDFFKIVSSLFAIKENFPSLEIHKNSTEQELMVQSYLFCKKLNIIETLKALRITAKVHEDRKFPEGYYLLEIDIEKKTVSLEQYKKGQQEEATKKYLEIEKKIEKEIGDSKNAVVLVSADSLKSLKKAYPSYFLDTSEFLSALEKINENCKSLGLVN